MGRGEGNCGADGRASGAGPLLHVPGAQCVACAPKARHDVQPKRGQQGDTGSNPVESSRPPCLFFLAQTYGCLVSVWQPATAYLWRTIINCPVTARQAAVARGGERQHSGRPWGGGSFASTTGRPSSTVAMLPSPSPPLDRTRDHPAPPPAVSYRRGVRVGDGQICRFRALGRNATCAALPFPPQNEWGPNGCRRCRRPHHNRKGCDVANRRKMHTNRVSCPTPTNRGRILLWSPDDPVHMPSVSWTGCISDEGRGAGVHSPHRILVWRVEPQGERPGLLPLGHPPPPL